MSHKQAGCKDQLVAGAERIAFGIDLIEQDARQKAAAAQSSRPEKTSVQKPGSISYPTLLRAPAAAATIKRTPNSFLGFTLLSRLY